MTKNTFAKALLCSVMLATPVMAADPIEMKMTVPSVPTDLHTKALHVFKDAIDKEMPGAFDVQIYDSGSLFGQGADLDALQRGNAEMTYVSYQLIADALPQYGLLTAGYLFRSPEHYRAFLDSDIGQEFQQTVSDEMDIKILDACYLGTRQLNLRDTMDIETPEDLSGVKLRMPSSDAWLFLGKALGANPTPLPFGEVYLGLQTGTIDAQDNPLPTVEAAKFYEVTDQITLTSHLVDAINFSVSNQFWDELDDAQKQAVTAAAKAACDWNNAERVKVENDLVEFFEGEGLTVTTPDVDAFRTHVQKAYMDSPRAKDWPQGWVEKINQLAE